MTSSAIDGLAGCQIERPALSRLALLALRSGSIAAVRAFLARSPDLEARDAEGRTALMIAGSLGHDECVRLLLDAGANPTTFEVADPDAAEAAQRSDAVTPGPDPMSDRSARGLILTAGECARFEHDQKVRVVGMPLGVHADVVDDAGEQPGAQAGSAIEGGSAACTRPSAAGREWADADDWIVDEEPTKPSQDLAALSAAGHEQAGLSRFHGEAVGDDWDWVQLQLPSDRIAAGFSLGDATRSGLQRLFAEAFASGALVVARSGGGYGLSASGIDVAVRVAADAGLVVEDEDDPWLVAQGRRSPAGMLALGRETVDELENRLAARSAKRLLQVEAEAIGRLDKQQEAGLWSAVERALDDAVLAISASRTSLAIMRDLVRGLADARLPLERYTGLDRPDGQPDDVDDEIQDGDTEASVVGGVPDELVAAVKAIEDVLARDGDPDATAPEVRRCAMALRACSPTVDLLDEMAERLRSADEGAIAQVVRTEAEQIRRLRLQIVRFHIPHLLRIVDRYEGRGLDRDDLIQEGAIGLLKAVTLFDRNRGLRFWTYAIWWVRQRMRRAIADQSRLIRIPVHVGEVFAKLDRRLALFTQEHGRKPTDTELATLAETPVRVVARLASAAMEPVELDHRDAPDAPMLQEWLPDARPMDPSAGTTAIELRSSIDRMLGELDPRAAEIVRQRFGLGDREEETLEEIGRRNSVTRERIRQIEAKALKRMKLKAVSLRLRSFLEA